MITYPCWNQNQSMLVKRIPRGKHVSRCRQHVFAESHCYVQGNLRVLWILCPGQSGTTKCQWKRTQIAKFMGPTWGPPGSCRPQKGPMLAQWTLLSGEGPTTAILYRFRNNTMENITYILMMCFIHSHFSLLYAYLTHSPLVILYITPWGIATKCVPSFVWHVMIHPWVYLNSCWN